MRKILAIILACLAVSVIGTPTQAKDEGAPKHKLKVEKPDMEKIRAAITDPNSKFYYPKLMANYRKNDTVQSIEDYRYLYLGYMFQEDYDPYRTSKYAEKIVPYYGKEKLQRADRDSIIKYSELALQDNPFDLLQMNNLIYALRENNKNNRANIWTFRFQRILAAIMSTGSGLTQESAWYVISPDHEVNLVNFMNGEIESQDFVEPYYEYVKIKNGGNKGVEGYYFNIKDMLDQYYLKHPSER